MMDFLITLDYNLIYFLNQFAGQSEKLDIVVSLFTDNNLVKTGLIVLVLSWAWFKVDERQFLTRNQVVATLFSVVMSIFIARLIALNAPFRTRPEYDDALEFVLPYGAMPATLDGWSSFPSDHAAMYFSLSVGICFISRKLGLLALAFSAIFICFSRVYMGHHFLSDVLAGAMIGGLSSVIILKYFCVSRPSVGLVKAANCWPEYFYPLFTLFMALLYDMFWGARDLASTLIWAFSF